MVRYLYYLDYGVPSHFEHDLLFHVLMDKLADKYNIRHLRSLACDKCQIALWQAPQAESFIEAIRGAYSDGSPVTEIRTKLLVAVVKRPELIHCKGKRPTALRRMLSTCPSFAEELALAFAMKAQRT
jgi:hypothetical protein